MRLRAHTLTTECCTQREIGPVGVEDEASQCAMEAADEIKEGGTEVMPTATPDPPARRFGENRVRNRFRKCRQGEPAALALRRRIR